MGIYDIDSSVANNEALGEFKAMLLNFEALPIHQASALLSMHPRCPYLSMLPPTCQDRNIHLKHQSVCRQ